MKTSHQLKTLEALVNCINKLGWHLSIFFYIRLKNKTLHQRVTVYGRQKCMKNALKHKKMYKTKQCPSLLLNEIPPIPSPHKEGLVTKENDAISF